MSDRIAIGERVLLTLWVGALWSIGFIAAPVLFSVLDDRSLAGTLAGEMFRATAYLGLVCGVLLLLFNRLGNGARWRFWVLAAMVVLVAAGHFGITPMVAEMRDTGMSGTPEFGRLHGIASTLFLVTSLLGLGLVVGPNGRKLF